MKKIFLLLLVTTTNINAQITPKVFKNFPAHIVYQIDQLNSKIKLTEEQQLLVGQKLTTKDSVANAQIQKGNFKLKLKDYYTISKPLLIPILSAEELDDFMYQNDKNNRFLLALKSASQLKLNPTQIATIRQQNDLLNADLRSQNRLKVYKTKLDSILTKPQYGLLISSINANQSQIEAKKDFNQIKTVKLIADKDTVTLFKQLFDFHLIKNNILDIQSNKVSQNKLTELKNQIVLEKQPAILIRYNILTNGFFRKNLFSETIKHEKTLNLTAAQIDSVLIKYRALEIMKLNNTQNNQSLYKWKDLADFENNNINKILETKQLNILLYKKNEKKALREAHNNWNDLEKQEKTQNLDKNTTIKEFATYQLNYLVATDRIKMDKNQLNLFYKRDVELKKPELLKQLDATKQTETNAKSTKNELRW